MKNRALEIAAMHGYESIYEIAIEMNCSMDEVAALINKKECKEETIDKFCAFFKVTHEYLLCMTEVNNYERL